MTRMLGFPAGCAGLACCAGSWLAAANSHSETNHGMRFLCMKFSLTERVLKLIPSGGRISDTSETRRATGRSHSCDTFEVYYTVVSTPIQLAADRVSGSVPGHGCLTEVRLVGHVTRRCRVVSEDGILHHRLARAYGFEEVPQVRLHFVVGRPVVGDRFGHEFMAGRGIVFLFPFVFVGLAHGNRETLSV